MYEKYKMYIIVSVISFIIGCCSVFLFSRNELYGLSIRAEQVESDLRKARDAERQAEKRADELQVRLREASARIVNLQKRIESITNTATSIENHISTAQGLSDNSTELIGEFGEIISTIQKRSK